MLSAAATVAVRAGTALAVAGAAHAAWNAHHLRVPPKTPTPPREPVSVLVPARDERARVGIALGALLAQVGTPDFEVLVYDDESRDDTADVVRRVAALDERVSLVPTEPLPDGWLGKPHACHVLSRHAAGSVLVFLDADVVLEPHAVASAVSLLRSSGLDYVCPYPRQVAVTVAERLVQPLLQWSWLSTLPLTLAERSPRESLVAANGQLFVVDAEAYRRAGGHCAVRSAVLDDIALARALRRAGARGTVADGTAIAHCRMYDGWPALRDGYTKSLWSALDSPAGTAGVVGALILAYVVPPIAALRGGRAGLVGYAAGVAGRVVTGRRTGGRVVPDVLAHPVSVSVLAALTVRSWRRARNGELTWKGRHVAVPGPC